MAEIHHVDIDVGDDEIGLSRLLGKGIKEIRGYLSDEYHTPVFKLTKIELVDGTVLGVEGEHDFPYLVEYGKDRQPNFDEDTLGRLMAEADGSDPDEE